MQILPTRQFTGVVLLSLLQGVTFVEAARGQQASGPPPQASLMEASPVLTAIDADHDRIITSAGLDDSPAALQALDKNADGKLTRDEAGAPMPGRGGRGREGGRGEGGEPPQVPAPGPTAEELRSALMTLDENKDGKLAEGRGAGGWGWWRSSTTCTRAATPEPCGRR